MGIRKYKPTTPNLRWTATSDFQEITKTEPEKSLLQPLKKSGGRNVYGRITVRHRGGGHKRMYRIIDFKRLDFNIPAKVKAIEYDPNRSARIALLEYPNGKKSYIICPEGLKVGETVVSGLDENVEIKTGNCLPLRFIPLGTPIHNLELSKNKGAKIVRSAGALAQIIAKEGNFAHVRLPSGEVRLIHLDCRATIGQVVNIEHSSLSYGKAARSRW
jgi:large subunit ribosomal protein L2